MATKKKPQLIESKDRAEMDPAELEALENIMNEVYPGLQMFARDINLPKKLANKYKKGLIICERGFTDATDRFMGMVTTHRFVILSNHMADYSEVSDEAKNSGCVSL